MNIQGKPRLGINKMTRGIKLSLYNKYKVAHIVYESAHFINHVWDFINRMSGLITHSLQNIKLILRDGLKVWIYSTCVNKHQDKHQKQNVRITLTNTKQLLHAV